MSDSIFIAPTIRTPNGELPMPIRFGKPEDADSLLSWQVHEGHPKPQAARDAVEYARLASKRWRYYAQRNEVVKSMGELEIRTARSRDEVGFLLVANSNRSGGSETLAMAWCRRSWCHHLILDFLACHPKAFGGGSGYGGVGTAMLLALGLVTQRLGISLLWGEATEVSAGFYSENVLDKEPVTDHFFIKNQHLEALQNDGIRFAV